jgi:RND superfamily putative drug exporter
MHKDLFYRFGKSIYYCRWLIIVIWLLLILACIPFAPKLMEPFKAIGFS